MSICSRGPRGQMICWSGCLVVSKMQLKLWLRAEADELNRIPPSDHPSRVWDGIQTTRHHC